MYRLITTIAMLSQNELHKVLYESLLELGLTDNERKLYLLSLTNGPQTLTALAASLNIPRPNVYKVVEGLESKGLAKFSERKKFARTFVVEPPTKITEFLRQKRETIARQDSQVTLAMPDLLAMYSQGELPTNIKILQGTGAYIKIFFQILEEEKTCVDFCGSVEDYLGFLPQVDQERWTKIRVARGTRVRTLAFGNGPRTAAITQSAGADLREVRILNNTKQFGSAFQLFANKVVIWQPHAPLALLIEDQYIVQMLRALYETLWEGAK